MGWAESLSPPGEGYAATNHHAAVVRSAFIALAMPFLAVIAARSQTAEIGEELRLALQWFLEVLAEELDEVRGWTRKRKAPLHLYCDERGEPARIAAVLFKCARLLVSKHNTLSCICPQGWKSARM